MCAKNVNRDFGFWLSAMRCASLRSRSVHQYVQCIVRLCVHHVLVQLLVELFACFWRHCKTEMRLSAIEVRSHLGVSPNRNIPFLPFKRRPAIPPPLGAAPLPRTCFTAMPPLPLMPAAFDRLAALETLAERACVLPATTGLPRD